MSDNLGDVDKSQHGSGQHQRTDVDLGGVPAWANAALAGSAIAISIVSLLLCWWLYQRAVTAEQRSADTIAAAELARSKEYKQIQVQMMYQNAIMLREGLAKPGDMVFGPEGNLEYLGGSKFKKPKEK